MTGRQIIIADSALKTLKKMDPPTAALILGYIEKRLNGCADPRGFGRPLIADHSGKWRYRIGACRLLCLLDDHKKLITIVAIGHRRDIYS